MAGLATADTPLLLSSHLVSRQLLSEPSPQKAADYKHREDLIDALLCAWTAALWYRHGLVRCQVRGADGSLPRDRLPPSSRLPALNSGVTVRRGQSREISRSTVRHPWRHGTDCHLPPPSRVECEQATDQLRVGEACFGENLHERFRRALLQRGRTDAAGHCGKVAAAEP